MHYLWQKKSCIVATKLSPFVFSFESLSIHDTMWSTYSTNGGPILYPNCCCKELFLFFFAFLNHQVKDMLRNRHGPSPLNMAALSGSKDVLEHVLSVIRRELTQNEVRCHFVQRIGYTTQQTTTIGGFTQDILPVSLITLDDQSTP